MFINTFSRRIVFNIVCLLGFLILYILLFYKVYTSENIIISFAVHPFNICKDYPNIWLKLKLAYIPITFISSLICINISYSSIFTKKNFKVKAPIKSDKLSLFITKDVYRFTSYFT